LGVTADGGMGGRARGSVEDKGALGAMVVVVVSSQFSISISHSLLGQ
jgi:hypothetical protein